MPVLQADLDALAAAIANGEKSVRFADGRAVEYHTPGDLIKAHEYLAGLKAREERPSRVHKLYHAGRGFQ